MSDIITCLAAVAIYSVIVTGCSVITWLQIRHEKRGDAAGVPRRSAGIRAERHGDGRALAHRAGKLHLGAVHLGGVFHDGEAEPRPAARA